MLSMPPEESELTIMEHTNQWHVEKQPEERPAAEASLQQCWTPITGHQQRRGGTLRVWRRRAPSFIVSSASYFLLQRHNSRRIMYERRNNIFWIFPSNDGAEQTIWGADIKYGLCILLLLLRSDFSLLLGPVTLHSRWKSKHIITMFPACYLWNPVGVRQHVIT